MRKVLHLRSTGELLGAERVILELAKYLPKFNYQPIIGIPVEKNQALPEFVSAAKQLGYEVVTFPISTAFDISAIKAIKKYVQENQIDIIHSHGYREDFYAIFARTTAKLVATNHLWKRTSLRLRLYAALDARLLKRFNSIIAVSEPVQQDMLQCKIPADNINVIPNGIDAAAFSKQVDISATRKSLNIPEDAIIIGTLSSLSKEKGLEYIIKASAETLQKITNIHLLLVGDGPEREQLQALVQKLSLSDSVTFAGRRSDINDVLGAMDIFALPSLNEGLPMALLEAMASEKAVIATRVGDVEKVITAESGIVIAPANVAQLSSALIKLASDQSIRKELGYQAKIRIQQNFSSLAMARANAAIYDNVLNH